jgi:hypothetical protein
MRYFFSVLILLQVPAAQAQCPTCSPDLSCASLDGQPTLCPESLPIAFSGEYYEQILTFFLPSTVLEPELNVTVTLEQITISSVTGLPFGITYSTNNPDGVYFPSQGENYGCATLCGTPLVAGVYEVLINVGVIATVAGFEVTQTQSFTYTLIVDQGSTSTASFTADNTASCGELTSNFEATIAGTPAQVTTYNWNLGNGEFSNQANVSATYNEEGTYQVSLNTVISDFVLNEVNLGNINENGDGDIDEFFSGPADPYFTLIDNDGNVVYTSSTFDNTTTAVWSNLNLVLSNPNYTITFWDEDDVTQDDTLSIFNISMGTGLIVFNSGDGTVGTFTIDLEETLNLTDEVSVTVLASPDVTVVANDNVLSIAENNASVYQWFLNGSIIAGASAQNFNALEGGVYTCAVTNEFGCSATSENFILCLPLTPIYDEVANEIYVDNIFSSYQWTFNGLPLEGADDFFIVDPASGNYGVLVTTDYGCEIEGEIITVVNAIDEEETFDFSAFPNPSDGIFWVDLQGITAPSVDLDILSLDGKIIQNLNGISTREIFALDLSKYSAGAYLIRVTFDTHSSCKRLFKN